MSQISFPTLSHVSHGVGSIVDQPKYRFSFLYNELKRQETISKSKASQKRKFFTTHHTVSKSTTNIPSLNQDNFNLSKRIQLIRQSTRAPNYSIPNNPSKISYSKDKIHLVFESSHLLKQFNQRQFNNILKENCSLSNFLQANKEITKKNLLIKFLKNESDIIQSKELAALKTLTEGQRNLIHAQKTFNEYIQKQKKSCKEIENVLNDINTKNRELSDREYEYIAMTKRCEEDIEKVLDNIETYKKCAKFIKRVLGGDYMKYKDIIRRYKDKRNKKEKKAIVGFKVVDYEKTVEEVIKNYTFCLEEKSKDQYFLEDPHFLLMMFKEKEDRILSMIDQTSQYNIERNRIIEESNTTIKDLEKRKNKHEKEYKMIKKESDEIENEVGKLRNNTFKGDFALLELIREIHREVIGDELIHGGTKVHKVKDNDIIKECTAKILSKEKQVNELIELMEKAENDQKVFSEIVNSRKITNKETKQNQAKEKLQEMLVMRNIKAKERFNRVVVQSRKTEAPFHFTKKEKKDSGNKDDKKNEERDLMDY